MREAVLSVSDAAFDAIGIGDLVALCRDAGLREFDELACHGTGAVVLVEVETRLATDRLSALDCVDEWELVAETEGVYRYVVAFTAPELPDELTDRAEDLVGECDPDVTDRGAEFSLVGAQETIRDAIDDYESGGMSPDLRKLGSYDGRSRPLEDLTDRQREVIRTAYEMGYYEVPRTATTGDVAAELAVDSSTVSEHLQRAERNLLRRHLSSGR